MNDGSGYRSSSRRPSSALACSHLPSSSKGLDSRKLSQVKRRDMTEDNSPDMAYTRLRHSRLAAILGEAGAKEYELNLANFRKDWAKK